jgi:hypothetical protein
LVYESGGTRSIPNAPIIFGDTDEIYQGLIDENGESFSIATLSANLEIQSSVNAIAEVTFIERRYFTFEGKTFFHISQRPNSRGYQLWVLSNDQLSPLQGLELGGYQGTEPHNLTVFGDYLYFSAEPTEDRAAGRQIWRTDGQIIEKVTDFRYPQRCNNISDTYVFDGKLYFFCSGPDIGGSSVFSLDSSGTSKISENLFGSAGFFEFGNSLFLVDSGYGADSGVYIVEGAALRLIQKGSSWNTLGAKWGYSLGSEFFFCADSNTPQREMYMFDGEMVQDLGSGPSNRCPHNSAPIRFGDSWVYNTIVNENYDTALVRRFDSGSFMQISADSKAYVRLANSIAFLSGNNSNGYSMNYLSESSQLKSNRISDRNEIEMYLFDLRAFKDKVIFTARNNGVPHVYITDSTKAVLGPIFEGRLWTSTEFKGKLYLHLGPSNYSGDLGTLDVKLLGCNSGTYYAPNFSECLPSPLGKHVPSANMHSPIDCEPGTFSNAVGATACLVAPQGFFVQEKAATEAAPCSRGTFTYEEGSVTCTQAPRGFYVSTVAATKATMCSKGLTTASTGATSSTSCYKPIVQVLTGFKAPTALKFSAKTNLIATTTAKAVTSFKTTGPCSAKSITLTTKVKGKNVSSKVLSVTAGKTAGTCKVVQTSPEVGKYAAFTKTTSIKISKTGR